MSRRKNGRAAMIIAVVVAVIGLFMLWPAIANALKKSTGNSSGGGVGLGPLGFPKAQQRTQGTPQSPLPGLAGAMGNLLGKHTGSALGNWINGVLNYGWSAASTMPVTLGSGLTGSNNQISLDPMQSLDMSGTYFDPSADTSSYLDAYDNFDTYDQIPLDQMQSLDMSSTYYDPSSSDMYDTADMSYATDYYDTSIDPFYGSDSLSVDYNDLTDQTITS